MKHLFLAGILTATGAVCVSAQLAVYTDETGRKIYVQDNPKPEAAPPKPEPAPASKAQPLAPKAKLTKSKVRSSAPAIQSPFNSALAGFTAPSAEAVVANATLSNATPINATLIAAGGTPASGKLEDIVQETARRHDVDPNLVKAIIKTESNGSIRALSPKGAMGLMQLMPGTARGLGVSNSFDPAQNVDGGVRYLKYLMGLYGGDVELSLAAYNAGPGAVERFGGRVPPYRETQQYVKKIGNLYGSLRPQPQTPQEVKVGIQRYVDEDGRVIYTNTR